MIPSMRGGSMVSPRPLRSSSPFLQLRRRSTAMCMGGGLDVILERVCLFISIHLLSIFLWRRTNQALWTLTFVLIKIGRTHFPFGTFFCVLDAFLFLRFGHFSLFASFFLKSSYITLSKSIPISISFSTRLGCHTVIMISSLY